MILANSKGNGTDSFITDGNARILEPTVGGAQNKILVLLSLTIESRYTAAAYRSSVQEMTAEPDHPDYAREAKAIVALAFRNGPIEDLHFGKRCPACQGKAGYSRISNAEMKLIMKDAVNRVFWLLRLKVDDPESYARQIAFGERYTTKWDEPE